MTDDTTPDVITLHVDGRPILDAITAADRAAAADAEDAETAEDDGVVRIVEDGIPVPSGPHPPHPAPDLPAYPNLPQGWRVHWRAVDPDESAARAEMTMTRGARSEVLAVLPDDTTDAAAEAQAAMLTLRADALRALAAVRTADAARDREEQRLRILAASEIPDPAERVAAILRAVDTSPLGPGRTR